MERPSGVPHQRWQHPTRAITLSLAIMQAGALFGGEVNASERLSIQSVASAQEDDITTASDLLGIQPDNAKPDELQAGNIVINAVWPHFIPDKEKVYDRKPCRKTDIAYKNHCFIPQPNIDQQVRNANRQNQDVTMVVYGTPWFMQDRSICKADIFCTPKKPERLAEFAGFLAWRYNGQHGAGAVSKFVIWNEVNRRVYMDTGCAPTNSCSVQNTVSSYARMFIPSYDAIVSENPSARVLYSLDHLFLPSLDSITPTNVDLSAVTFLQNFLPILGQRPQAGLALHPYNEAMGAFASRGDMPLATLGSLGVAGAQLIELFPNYPFAHDLFLTEVGLKSDGPGAEDAQREGLCQAMTRIAATPGVKQLNVHRWRDNPDEPVELGLHRADGNMKPSARLWRQLVRTKQDCGLNNLPYTTVYMGEFSNNKPYIDTLPLETSAVTREIFPLWRDASHNRTPIMICEDQTGQYMALSCLPKHITDMLHAADEQSVPVALEYFSDPAGSRPIGVAGYAENQVLPERKPLYLCLSSQARLEVVTNKEACAQPPDLTYSTAPQR